MFYLQINTFLRILIGIFGLLILKFHFSNQIIADILFVLSLNTVLICLVSFGLDQYLLVNLNRNDKNLKLLNDSLLIRLLIYTIVYCVCGFIGPNYVGHENFHILQFTIIIYSSEILNGSREYLIINNKYKVLFKNNLLSILLLSITCTIVYFKYGALYSTLMLICGNKFFFNIINYIYILRKYINLYEIKDYVLNLKISNFKYLRQSVSYLFFTTVICHFINFEIFSYIKTNYDNFISSNYGFGHKAYTYAQIPINLYIVTRLKVILALNPKTIFKKLIKKNVKYILLIFSVIISVTLYCIYISKTCNNYFYLYVYMFVFFFLMLGLYTCENLFVKFLIRDNLEIIFFFKSLFILTVINIIKINIVEFNIYLLIILLIYYIVLSCSSKIYFNINEKKLF